MKSNYVDKSGYCRHKLHTGCVTRSDDILVYEHEIIEMI